MCGIFAAMTRQPLAPEHRDAALKVLFHRGPDGSGSWTSSDRRWVLGHTRLSIIGLNNGEQPMTSPDGTVHLVVNGEFYGYREIRDRLRASGCRFATDSDSEIALHLYQQRGMQVATELRGEFAVIIADERQRVMIAIRDRFGIKPLYYAVINGDVYFASEIKALLALGVPARWDLEGATGGFSRSHEITEFAGIATVPPGCYAIAKDGNVRIYEYWDWEIPTAEQMQKDSRSDAEVVEEFRHIGIGLAVDAFAAGTEMDDGGRRNADLGGLRGVFLEEAEGVGADSPGPVEAAGDHRAVRRMGDFLARFLAEMDGHAALDFNAVDGEHEIVPPVPAAKIAIGDALQSRPFLKGDGVADRFAFDLPQLIGADRALLKPVPGVDQGLGTQQAAEVIGAKGR